MTGLFEVVSEIQVRAASVAILILVFVLCFWIVIGYLTWMNDHQPTGVLPRRQASQLSEPSAQPHNRPHRLVLVVFDGLRADHSRRMPSMNRISMQGVDFTIDVGFPTYSRAGYAVYSTGVRGDRSGIRTNAYAGEATVDSIWERAVAAGLTVDGVSNLGWWQELFPTAFSHYVVSTMENFPSAAQVLLEADNNILLIHPTHIDFAGHEAGARSAAYRDAVSYSNRMLEEWFDGLDLRRDSILVVSDHGHTRRGGHGGPEPEIQMVRGVASGLGWLQGSAASIQADQVASTLAVLLGLPFPWDAGGEPLWDVLDSTVLGQDYLDIRRAQWERQTTRYMRALQLTTDVEMPRSGDFDEWRAALKSDRREVRRIRIIIAALGLLGGLILILKLRRESLIRVLLAGIMFSAVFLIAALLTNNATSLSVAEREYRYVLRLVSLSTLAFVSQLLTMRMLRVRDWDTVFMAGAWLPLSSVLLVLAFYGIPLTPPLPPPAVMFWPLVGTFMVAAQAGLGALLLVSAGILEIRRDRAFSSRQSSLRQEHKTP